MKFQRHTLILLLALALQSATVSAQGYKRYPTLEHFTNTWCSSCASRNPAMFTYLNGFAGQYHHMSIHPSIPYAGCELYKHNTVENTARKTYYSVASTPSVYMNGSYVSASTLLPPASFTTALLQKSALGIQVTETTGATRQATVTIHRSGGLLPGTQNYVLHVAVLEKTLNYASPNGEQVHHNVFRKFLTPTAGLAYTPPATDGGNTVNTFTYSMDAAWNPAEIYLIAFVQNTGSKDILNSGTRFDNFSVDTNEPIAVDAQVQITPNPVEDNLTIHSANTIQSVKVLSMQGRIIAEQVEVQDTAVQLDAINWKSGIYIVQVRTNKGIKTEKVIKI
jgi:Outer membrane protein Omp28/Secretion system C-terminal sorting domain